ncbi:MAG: 6-O-methylguanine DNA methyltransferase [Candidatus Tokpelaia hoelldobleri]|uniref:methylated-DNA--[protein]-cysteine S-methyltransferase n=1 Tax=Candidatus Tokpelaia hoelldobleri TaxID=1902579 RepID=A0A1U9JSE3_9HYPH|nr:MAG: 6-O-methylguanine DNA methyltransferase [Candidatus Tokpelaia hoelldoblerii]
MMTDLFNNSDTLYQAFLARDRSYDGHMFVCVATTGIFCRLSCPARKPGKDHVRFFETAAACLEQGYRPCKKCRPLEPAGQPEPIISNLLARLEQNPDHVWSETDLAKLGLDPSTVRRLFKRHIGMTFLDLARLRRAGRGITALAQGANVIDAQLDAGYDSASGFRDAVTRLLGQPPARLKGRHLLQADWMETPVGAMLAIADRHRLHLLEFFERKALTAEIQRLQKTMNSTVSFGRSPPIDQIEKELAAYFKGESAAFHTPLARHGSPFTCKVWDALTRIPPGVTHSYAQLAQTIGQPTAMRAVARANGANQLAIIIPCHRVIGANGSLTGYAGGLWRKNWLLTHEKRYFPACNSLANSL